MAPRKPRIGIFGGTFNPPHNGHLHLARQLLLSARLDEVWFMVSPQNPFKANDVLLGDAIRLRMVQRALEGEARMVASDYEFGLSRPSYTYHTLTALSQDYPSKQFILLIGADNWLRFDDWFRGRDIIRRYSIVVYPREGSPVDAASLPRRVKLVDTERVNVSSTDIRRRVAAGEPIDELVPPQVAEMIRAEGLYRSAEE